MGLGQGGQATVLGGLLGYGERGWAKRGRGGGVGGAGHDKV